VFRVGKITDPTHVFKVNMNAKQLALSGFVIKPSSELSSFPCLVVVEGGLRAVKFYKNLMLRRIHWAESHPSNECKLIWEGQIESSSAGKWRMHEVGDEVEAIRWLTEKKL
jgi:U4/U6 small nuclear ribonucleoprotein PRP3